jgi:hypothetical protein
MSCDCMFVAASLGAGLDQIQRFQPGIPAPEFPELLKLLVIPEIRAFSKSSNCLYRVSISCLPNRVTCHLIRRRGAAIICISCMSCISCMRQTSYKNVRTLLLLKESENRYD